MPRLFNIFLQIYLRISKTRLSLCLCHHKRINKSYIGMRNTHSPSSSAAGCLDNNRIPYFFCNCQCLIFILDRAFTPRDNRDPCLSHSLFCLTLITHKADYSGRWPDKGYVTGFTDLGKVCILSQKPISRMNSICIGYLRSAYYAWDT